jgi:ribose transport system substrate-binding protein
MMVASSENSYSENEITESEQEAKELGDVKIVTFSGQFSASVQQQQLETIESSGEYSGVVLNPNDGVSIASDFPSSIPVVSILTPVGSNIADMQPQAKGVLTTIALPPGSPAKIQAQYTLQYCKSKKLDPCNVVLMVGMLSSNLDVVRQQAMESVLATDPDIKVVKTLEGGYDRTQGYDAMDNFLQGDKDVNAVISTGDQMTWGVQLALTQAHINVKDVYLDSAGGTQYAISQLRAGNWGLVYVNYPGAWAADAVKLIVEHLKGEKVPTWIDQDDIGPVPAYQTPATIKKYPNFAGEWQG